MAAAPPAIWAHRGARAVAPENTLEAFRRAFELGADGVELDVHCTADACLVVHHDADAPGLGVIAERTRAEVREARADIPTLAEALDCCLGHLVNVEIKHTRGTDGDPGADALVALLAERGERDDVLVSSFDLATIDRVRELDPSLPTGYLLLPGADIDEAIACCVERGHAALHPGLFALAGDLAEQVVGAAHDAGLAVNVWTVNDPAEVQRLARAGVDAIITDVPDVARAAI